MTTATFNNEIKKQLAYCEELLVKKGEEYSAGNTDRLHSFKRAASLQKCTPKQALFGMLTKHLISVSDMCQSGWYSDSLWQEKITDSINYLLILRALTKESDNEI